MNGDRLLLDTNIILYLLGGNKVIANYLFGKILYTSIISEIDLLNHQSIKELVIQIRRNYSVKIPDAIIAATAINLGIPLVTADKAFRKIQELPIDFYNNKS